MNLAPIVGLWDNLESNKASPIDGVALAGRYRGVLLGTAAGNLLGIPVEGHSKPSVQRRFPNGVREIDPCEEGQPWDDDVAQTVVLAEAMLDSRRLDLEDLGQRLVKWMRENGRGIGILTLQVLTEIAGGTPASSAARQVWEAGGRQSAGNGAVMRCAPVALR